MSIVTPLMFRSLARMMSGMVTDPTATITTLLYCSDLLPRNLNLDRLVRPDLLHRENYLFHFLITILRCFWYTGTGTKLEALGQTPFCQANLRASL
ncbi:hypothetical protein LOK49_LG14G01894 [Camellia lanceoleosa]|uniref:Uncharacterized protein n=1 Tax=Camellia lanceoleosa TaxID=1840588 RepID=A0ACC0FAN7_9ERIC|nr:hypothetical protein LOK49_LG14G01894 [Camellia lanceoleosa]